MNLGADAAIHASEDVPARFRALNGGRPADLVIVCAGALSAYRQALLSVDRGGTILCFAPTDPDIELPVPVNDFWRNEIRVLPSYGNAPHDAAVAIELIRSGRVPVEKMITHRLSLAEAGLGFKLVAEAGEAIKGHPLPLRHEGRVYALQCVDLNGCQETRNAPPEIRLPTDMPKEITHWLIAEAVSKRLEGTFFEEPLRRNPNLLHIGAIIHDAPYYYLKGDFDSRFGSLPTKLHGTVDDAVELIESLLRYLLGLPEEEKAAADILPGRTHHPPLCRRADAPPDLLSHRAL